VSHRLAFAESDVPAFELLILMAVRSGDLRGARWSEIDLQNTDAPVAR